MTSVDSQMADSPMNTQRFLLCTDLDRTLLPNGPEPESPGARDLFKRLADRPGVTLVYVSGRDQVLLDDAITQYNLPQPEFAITDVGTRILRHDSGDWQIWPDWSRDIGISWAGKSHADISRALSGLEPLRLQEAAKQNTYKLSYYLPLQADRVELEREILRRLKATGARVNLVWSIDEPAGVGLLDVLPERANKLHAVEFIRGQLGFELQQALFAGDSGNDLNVLESFVPSVLVANATDDVRHEAMRRAREKGNADALYIACGGYLGMNGNYSAGILEGVHHFYPQLMTEFAADQAS